MVETRSKFFLGDRASKEKVRNQKNSRTTTEAGELSRYNDGGREICIVHLEKTASGGVK